ncbi:putative Chemotaxis protein CheA modulated with response regulator receiver region (Modular protein) [Nitrospira japonica]|uniref:Chemotaxis protein CheA n=1 Tax=Nitrospira japonica TaxID=1325564 RepID=A0A1W1I9U7_9BACT|nr:hybrid sensor histidine kinase/response regulator [Nitrospira japonica]SLM49691.1 putative Chemotaxis protein CheA modulated with response regulator receiver region (Modular protein) [Nitrospira japonica]
MSSELDRQALIDIFVMEASEAALALATAVNPPGDALPTAQELQNQYVWAHKVRGAAGIYGFSGLATLGALLESVLEQSTGIAESSWPNAVGMLRGMIETFQGQLDVVKQGGQEDLSVSERWRSEVESLIPKSAENAAERGDGQPPMSPQYLVPSIDADVLSYFAPEADEYLQTIDTLVQRLDESPQDQDALFSLYRTAHTLKGSAHTIGFKVVGDVAHHVEECLIAVREGKIVSSPALMDAVVRAMNVVRTLMRRDEGRIAELQRDVPAVTEALSCICLGKPLIETTSAPAVVAPQLHTATAVMEMQPAQAVEKAVEEAPQLTDEYLLPQLDPEVLSYFAPEAQEYLESLEAQLLRLEKEPTNPELINQLFRTAHTLKGSAYTVGFQSIGDLTHYVEDFMGAVREGRVRVLPGHADMLLKAVDVVRLLMRRDPTLAEMVRQRFTLAMQGLKRLEQPITAGSAVSAPVTQTAAAMMPSPEQSNQAESETARVAEGKSKEAGSEDREVIRVSRDRLERLLNLVGELVIGRGRLEQRLRVLEQLSQQVLAFKGRLMDSVRSFEEKHTFTLPSSGSAGAESGIGRTGTSLFPGLSDFGSLEFDKYDDFNILARRISEVTADISESMSQLSGSIRRSHEDMSQLQQLTLAMRDEIARARMVPIGTPFTRFRRATREMARATGKEVTLVTSGEHTEVDTGVVERLVDPLVHLVRNAVFHGIEPAAARVAKGKPAAGSIYLHASHRGNAVLIEVEDDGAGLDIDKIRAKAVERGLVRADVARSLSDAEAIKFIFMPGFSTADQIGDQAGRGVGMDVVKRVIESMNGHIDVESVRGIGTKFTLHLPLTLLIATALMVRTGSERYGIPLPSVREVTMLTGSSLQQVGDRTIIQIGEEAIEVQPLHRMLVHGSGSPVEAGKPVVIVRTGVGPVGLMVDELLGRQEIVIKPIASLKSLAQSTFGGATIDPEGRVILVLDPARLVSGGAQAGAALEDSTAESGIHEPETPYEETVESRSDSKHILLIDDSLSIRKFVGRMLETAGYEVETAVDGEEGLRKASAQQFRLILTDLEMPKLNGYEVIQALRSRPQTQQTPIIVMTTRAGDKHRQMAINIGASSYIAKPVEERALIQELERWIGQEISPRKT